MNVVRWVLFLVVATVLTNLVFFGIGWVSAAYSWWIVLLIFIFASLPIVLAGTVSTFVAPNRKIGGFLFIGLVVVGELFKAPEMLRDWPFHMIFWRLLADIVMIQGALHVALTSERQKYLE